MCPFFVLCLPVPVGCHWLLFLLHLQSDWLLWFLLQSDWLLFFLLESEQLLFMLQADWLLLFLLHLQSDWLLLFLLQTDCCCSFYSQTDCCCSCYCQTDCCSCYSQTDCCFCYSRWWQCFAACRPSRRRWKSAGYHTTLGRLESSLNCIAGMVRECLHQRACNNTNVHAYIMHSSRPWALTWYMLT